LKAVLSTQLSAAKLVTLVSMASLRLLLEDSDRISDEWHSATRASCSSGEPVGERLVFCRDSFAWWESIARGRLADSSRAWDMLLSSGERMSVPWLLWWAWKLLFRVEVDEYLECVVDCNEDANDESELRLSENLCFGEEGGVLMRKSFWRLSC
jgi:hypothetical protein